MKFRRHKSGFSRLICTHAMALLFVLLTATIGLALERNDSSTTSQISELRAQADRLRQENELKAQEIELWKEKYQRLEERYRNERLWHTIREIEEEVGKLRMLQPKVHVPYRMVNEQELLRLVEKQIEKQYGDRMDDYEMALRLLGFWHTKINLKQLIIDLYREQAMGVYDFDSHQLVLRPFFDPEKGFGRAIVAHEMCHALQDQYFDVAQICDDRMGNDDALLAALSVIEGDATLLMGDYTSRHLSPAFLLEMPKYLSYDQSIIMNAPHFIRQTLLFPYVQGVSFVSEAIQRKGPTEADIIFRDIPSSTEQILHPEKYFVERDDPTTLVLHDFSDELGPDWKMTYTNVLGEYSIRLIFEEDLGVNEATAAAAGWDGDRYALYRRDTSSYCLYWESVWDTEENAEEFLAAFKDLIKIQHAEAKMTEEKRAADALMYKTAAGWIRLLRLGQRVYCVLCNDAAVLPVIVHISDEVETSSSGAAQPR
jgi:hypothetical protein